MAKNPLQGLVGVVGQGARRGPGGLFTVGDRAALGGHRRRGRPLGDRRRGCAGRGRRLRGGRGLAALGTGGGSRGFRRPGQTHLRFLRQPRAAHLAPVPALQMGFIEQPALADAGLQTVGQGRGLGVGGGHQGHRRPYRRRRRRVAGEDIGDGTGGGAEMGLRGPGCRVRRRRQGLRGAGTLVRGRQVRQGRGARVEARVAAHRRRCFSGAERAHRFGGLPGHGHVDPFAQHLMQQGIQNRRDAAHGVSSSRWNAESMEVASWGP